MTLIVPLLFWLLAFVCCGFAAMYGGRSGREVALACLAGIVTTFVVTGDDRAWITPHLAAAAVDTLLFVVLLWIVIRSDRWFPIWLAGLQLVTVISHAGSIFAPTFAPKIYFLLQSFWAIPMFITLVVGVALDRHAGVADARRPPADL